MKNIEIESEDQIFANFAEWLQNEGKAENTIKTYLAVLEKFFMWLKERQLTSIAHKEVQEYISYLEEQQRSPGTTEKYLAAISVFSRFSGNSDIILNIARKEKDKDYENPEFLDDNEIKTLLSTIEKSGNERNIAIIYTLLHTGIRISELCALDRSDVEISRNKGKISVRDKVGINRVIPLSKQAIKYLTDYLDTRDDNTDALFISSLKKRISPRGVQYMLEKYNVNPHKLRHTFCKQLVNKGIDIHTIAKLAGHKDVNVTKRYADDGNINLEDAIDQAF